MKINFKKITAIGASLLMAGMTAGIAAAATFPAPFVTSGVANVAIVYGTGTGVSPTDMVEAGNIQTTLGESMPSTGVTTIEGDSYKFEKTSTKFHLGDHYVNITTNLDEDELPNLLATGKYIDDDNDEFDYTQKITMGALGQLMMFDDDDYKADTPTIGFRIPASQTILTYAITFSDTPLVTDMPTSNLPLMGKNYYVLSNTSTTLTLLDSAASAIVAADETITLDVDGTPYTVSASIFDTANSKVKLLINGETTNLLGSTETQKLTDGAYVGVKEVIVQNFQGGTNQVEFSIGKGKLVLTDGGSDVKINDNAISGVIADFDLTANVLTKINITWSAEDEVFITEDTTATMPGFEIAKLSYGGINYPVEEVITVKKGGTTYAQLDDFPLKDGVKDIEFLYGDSTSFTALGKDASNLFVTDANRDGNITFDSDTDAYFVASWTDATTSSESYLMKVTNFITESSVDKADIQYWVDGDWSTKKTKAKATDTISIGTADLTIGAVSNSGNSMEIWKTNADTTTSITSFNTLFSKEGMTLYLPWENTTATLYNNATSYSTATAACVAFNAANSWRPGEIFTGTLSYNSSNIEVSTTACATSWTMKMVEEDKSENRYAGDTINLTIGWDSSTTKEVEVSDVVGEEVTFKEIGDTDVWRSFMYSALATEILWTKPSSGQKSVKIMYHGDEVAADVYISSADAVITGGTTLGNVIIKDTEINDFKTKNLIIVGGSCINSAAAGLLGSACGPSFTTATGVGTGQFLIQSFGDAYTTGKIALLVAGYELADTKNAATYLRTQSVDTTAGNKYVGTSSTEATLQVA